MIIYLKGTSIGSVLLYCW